MNSHSRRRRRRQRGIPGALLLLVLLVVIVVAVLLFRGCTAEKPEQPSNEDTAQTDGNTQTDNQDDSQTEDSQPQEIQTSTGVSCTLTDLGEEAIYTGELVLVNNWTLYHFPEEQELVSIYAEKNDSYYVAGTEVYLAPVAMEALNAMLADFTAQGGSKSVNVVAGYRTEEFQQHLFDQSAEQNGLEHAKQYVAQPGGSEHHTGFVVDLSIYHSDGTSEEYDGTGEYAWINENCQNYGYVVRYATDKADLTGIANEPWHFRYVGVPHARLMIRLGLTLEEYVDLLRRDFRIRYYAGADRGPLPEEPGRYRQVSEDNCGGLVVTAWR